MMHNARRRASDGRTTPPLHRAARNGDTQRVKQLLRAGKSAQERDPRGRTPGDFAELYGHRRLRKMLKKAESEEMELGMAETLFRRRKLDHTQRWNIPFASRDDDDESKTAVLDGRSLSTGQCKSLPMMTTVAVAQPDSRARLWAERTLLPVARSPSSSELPSPRVPRGKALERKIARLRKRDCMRRQETSTDEWLQTHGRQGAGETVDKAKRELRKLFAYLDKNGDGKISIAELVDPMLSTGVVATAEEVEEVVARADRDSDGAITLHDLMRAVLPARGISHVRNDPSQSSSGATAPTVGTTGLGGAHSRSHRLLDPRFGGSRLPGPVARVTEAVEARIETCEWILGLLEAEEWSPQRVAARLEEIPPLTVPEGSATGGRMDESPEGHAREREEEGAGQEGEGHGVEAGQRRQRRQRRHPALGNSRQLARGAVTASSAPAGRYEPLSQLRTRLCSVEDPTEQELSLDLRVRVVSRPFRPIQFHRCLGEGVFLHAGCVCLGLIVPWQMTHQRRNFLLSSVVSAQQIDRHFATLLDEAIHGARWLGDGNMMVRIRRLRQKFHGARVGREERVRSLRPVLLRHRAEYETQQDESERAMARVRQRKATMKLRSAVTSMRFAFGLNRRRQSVARSTTAEWAAAQLDSAAEGAVTVSAAERQQASDLNHAAGGKGMQFRMLPNASQRTHLDLVRRAALHQVHGSQVKL